MARRHVLKVAVAAVLPALASCAAIVSPTESVVNIHTSPERAHCAIKGRDGFSKEVDTPVAVSLPASAAPLTVTCTAAGYRPTVYTLDTGADGWIWGNSAFVVATGGVGIIGALVDGGLDAGKVYKPDAKFALDPDTPRLIKVRDRSGGTEMDLRVR